MAGLFGWFGKKKNADASPPPAPKNGTRPEAYFLEADDAKTMGNIEYMRSTKVIKHKFPKTAGNGGEFEVEYEVSSSDARFGNGLGAASETTPTPPAAKAQEVAQRRTADTGMDMFRNMARDIRKR
ncbi:MAG: hypothetical protein Fur0046_39540 [Cyanobacteria bacterium J069]|nr:MAG: hypothetical protein D6742_15690 [Cyanobacteria bacterium J069]